ncbi:hypothetical protein E2C01_045677 [Portunus trituberculatus]|uniref:Uncharacterized protein n=1 Tax=Portunus trituberculatus TaxID=210409 RepID=A0A5B7G3M4_PORTR|nr:hypothetical protein [Portunus trituberculatus]
MSEGWKKVLLTSLPGHHVTKPPPPHYTTANRRFSSLSQHERAACIYFEGGRLACTQIVHGALHPMCAASWARSGCLRQVSFQEYLLGDDSCS